MVQGINYNRLVESMEYYSHRGYKKINLPWIVDRKYIDLTYSDKELGNKFILDNNRSLIGSAEQSFLKKIIEENISGKFQSLTPCFRNNAQDELHCEYFMKNELFVRYENYNYQDYERALNEIIDDAYYFFNNQTLNRIKIIETFENEIINKKVMIYY